MGNLSKMSCEDERKGQTPLLFTSKESMASSKSSKNSILRNKLQAEKLVLEINIAEEKCEDKIKLIRAEAERRATFSALRKRAQELKIECEYEEALAKDDCVSDNEIIIYEEVRKLLFHSVNGRVSCSRSEAEVVNNQVPVRPPEGLKYC